MADADDDIYAGFENPRGVAATSVESNPDDAARAVQLSKSTGVPAPVIHDNLEDFTKNLQAQTAGQLTAQNPQLSRYVMSNPMASKVSSDDYAQLDTVSQATSKLAEPGIFDSIGNAIKRYNQADRAVTESVESAASSAFDLQGQKDEAQRFYNFIDSPAWRTFAGAIAPEIAGFGAFNAGFNALISGGAAGISTAYDKFGGQAFMQQYDKREPWWLGGQTGRSYSPESLFRDLVPLAQVAIAPEVGAPHMAEHLFPGSQEIAKATQAAEKAKPYVMDGKSVPVGIDPLIDEAKKAESDADLDRLKEAMKEAQASTTHERAPDMFRQFIAQHTGESTIGISSDAVQKLYGDKVPTPGDNLLGFVPDMASQLLRSAATGADVEVPTADLLAHMDPEVFKELEPSIRVKPDGVTKDEGNVTGESAALKASLEEVPAIPGEHNIVAYHGTQEIIPEFDPNKTRLNRGAFFSEDPALASRFATGDAVDNDAHFEPGEPNFLENLKPWMSNSEFSDFSEKYKKWEADPEGPGAQKLYEELYDQSKQATIYKHPDDDKALLSPNVSKVKLNLGKNLSVDMGGRFDWDKEKEAIDKAKAEGYNSVTFSNAGKDTGTYHTVFDKSQIQPFYQLEYNDPVQTLRQGAGLASDQLFDKASAIGMTQDQMGRYQKLIAAQQEADNEAALRRATAFERRTQTPEWRANRQEMQSDVSQEITQTPRFMADQGIRRGDIPKLDTDALTPEQAAGLPKAYHRRGGESPDLVARILGYDSGDDMITDLAALSRDRKESGLKPGEYITKLVSDETDRRMEAKYGKLDENIIEAAKEQVLSGTQLDLLHAQLEDLAGGQLPISKDTLRAQISAMVGDMKVGSISSDNLLAAAGREGRAAEDALLKGDLAEAFRRRQRQYGAVIQAKEALKIEKLQAQYDKIVKRYTGGADSAKLKSRDPHYVDAMQTLIRNLGGKTKRTLSNAERGMVLNGYKDFNDFVGKKALEGRSLFIPEFLKDGSFTGTADDLTGEQFTALADFVKNLDSNALSENQVWKAGEKVDRRELLDRMAESLKTLRDKPAKFNPNPEERQTAGQFTAATLWRHINTESMTNRMDHGDWFGDFNQTIFRPAIEGANYIDRLAKEYNPKFKEAMSDIGNISKKIENSLWKDRNGIPLDLNRGHLYAILQNVGNIGNRTKLFEGYGIPEPVGMQWLWQKLDKEPGGIPVALARAGKISKIFDELLEKADNMSRNENNGRGIDRIHLGEMDTPIGKIKEWYHPLDGDEMDNQYGLNRDKEALLQRGYRRADAPQTPGYTKARTQATYTVPLGLDLIPTRMSQMIHDIAMRPAINNLSKIIFDKKLGDAINDYYSPHVLSELKEWTQYIANRQNFDSSYEAWAGRVSDHFRSNMISTLVGANVGTIAKHGLTAAIKSFASMPVAFTKELVTLLGHDSETGERNYSMAMAKSDELARRYQNWDDNVNRRDSSVDAYRGGALNIPRIGSYLRNSSQWLLSKPIAFFDMLSSVPAWLATYKGALRDGKSEGDAITLSDRFVRQTHGSSVFVNKSGIGRSSGMASWWASLYNFFSENFQKQYETGWRIRDANTNLKAGNTEAAAHNYKVAAGLFFTASVLPAAIDMMLGESGDKKDSWVHTAANLIAGSIGSGFLPIKDLLWSIVHGKDPEGGLLPAAMKEISDPIRDLISHKTITPAVQGNFIKHFAGMMGLLTGVGSQSIGNVGKFAFDYYHNLEHPQNAWQTMVGLRYGKTIGHTKSFGDWLKSEVPQ